ncbi:MAG TPA: hypothetical protein VMB26_00465 [Candidatus Binataceae bacterium]|nr:hypothetical protein [Candidatus Binataceae bacterium]
MLLLDLVLFAELASDFVPESELLAESDLAEASDDDVESPDEVPLLDALLSLEEELESPLDAGLRA